MHRSGFLASFTTISFHGTSGSAIAGKAVLGAPGHHRRAPTITYRSWTCVYLRKVSVFAKRTSFVASYREFLLPRVECRVRPCVLDQQLVASECERLARTFVTRQFPAEIAGEGVHRAGETLVLKQFRVAVTAQVFVSCRVECDICLLTMCMDHPPLRPAVSRRSLNAQKRFLSPISRNRRRVTIARSLQRLSLLCETPRISDATVCTWIGVRCTR
jgi:hypothetical protein